MGKRGGKRHRRRKYRSDDVDASGSDLLVDVAASNKKRRMEDDNNTISSTVRNAHVDDDDDEVREDGPALPMRVQTSFIAGKSGSESHNVSLPRPLFSNEIEDKDGTAKKLFSSWKTFLTKTQKDSSLTTWAPTLIQRHLWSILMNSPWNAVGIAPTSSGKTLSYALPTLLFGSRRGSILVLVPTRELVQQVSLVYKKLIKTNREMEEKNPSKLSDSENRTVVSIYGGVNRADQVRAVLVARGKNIPLVVVATPGRLLDILEQQRQRGNCREFIFAPGYQHWIVLDEADQLTKEGDLGPQVQDILTLLSQKENVEAASTRRVDKDDESSSDATRLVFVSATLSEKSQLKFQEWMNNSDYVLVQVDVQANLSTLSKRRSDLSKESKTETPAAEPSDSSSSKHNETLLSRIPAHLEQIVHVCAEHKKPRKLVNILRSVKKGKKEKHATMFPLKLEENNRWRCRKGIVFYSKIEKLEYSCKLLKREGIQCLQLHGQLPTAIRQKHLHRFASAGSGRDGEKPLYLLLATDVAARGIDIPDVDFVIQYDFPGNLEQYVHRCGRAGRSSANEKTSLEGMARKDECGNASSSKDFVVYSFFTRNLHCMAGDLVHLLEANQAWVDPNLRALVLKGKPSTTAGKQANDHEYQAGMHETKKNQKSSKCVDSKREMGKNSYDKDSNSDFFSNDDEFAQLSSNRIVLKRASHVSDASEDEDTNSGVEE